LLLPTPPGALGVDVQDFHFLFSDIIML